ncbi:alpha/beta fold hydrolase [Catenulispora yoronensis]
MFHHGTPFAAVLFEPMVEAAARHGLRMVVHSRPGYAASSAQPGRTVASVVADVGELLAELGADRFLTVGWSGGGRMPWRAPRCCRSGVWPPRPSPVWLRTTPTGSTGWTAWARRTSRSSGPRRPGSSR